jgi:hypothetical protein
MEESKEDIEKRMAEEIEKKVEKGMKTGTAVLVAVAVTFIISVIVFKFVWAWVVPDLFPGAVAQGLISSDLSWLASLKLAVLVAALSGFYPSLVEAFQTRVD